MTTVTVLMPVYNGEKYLKEAIDSILGQTLSSFEFLAVDDGSTDSTSSILQYYRSKDTRIKVLTNRKNIAGPVVKTTIRRK
jgi:glycosyltransferase involved in cell wall biosynthesis